MSQRKSTSFSAAKVANFGVIMTEMVGKMGEMEKEIKRLRHHVSVLSKRNHQLVKDGKSGAASPIASDVSLSVEKGEEKRGVVAESVALVEENVVVAMSVAEDEEAEVAVPVVKLPVAVRGVGSKKRRVDGSEDGNGRKEEEEVLIAPLGPRAECGGLLRRVGKESVFADADPRYVAGGGPSRTTPIGISRGLDTRRQSPGVRGGYLLRPRVGEYWFDCGGRGRGRGR